jgi:flagellar motility protein MotE (MotC chaperone)
MDKKGIVLFFIAVIFLLPAATLAERKEMTPTGLLKAIDQRSQELDKQAKELTLKEQRLRILEQEVSEKLEKIKLVRKEMKRSEAEAKKRADTMEKKQEVPQADKSMGIKEEARKEEERQGREAKTRAVASKEEATKEEPAEENEGVPKKAPVKSKAEAKRDLVKKKTEAAKARAAQKRAKAKADAEKKRNQKAGEQPPAAEGAEEDNVPPPEEKPVDLAAVEKKERDRKALQDRRFKDLATIYDKMPPQEAALRLQNMNDVFSLEIIPRMKKKQSAKVLSLMDPVVAVRLTEKIGMGDSLAPAPPATRPPTPKR